MKNMSTISEYEILIVKNNSAENHRFIKGKKDARLALPVVL